MIHRFTQWNVREHSVTSARAGHSGLQSVRRLTITIVQSEDAVLFRKDDKFMRASIAGSRAARSVGNE